MGVVKTEVVKTEVARTEVVRTEPGSALTGLPPSRAISTIIGKWRAVKAVGLWPYAGSPGE
jgi:hypothetical protein